MALTSLQIETNELVINQACISICDIRIYIVNIMSGDEYRTTELSLYLV